MNQPFRVPSTGDLVPIKTIQPLRIIDAKSRVIEAKPRRWQNPFRHRSVRYGVALVLGLALCMGLRFYAQRHKYDGLSGGWAIGHWKDGRYTLELSKHRQAYGVDGTLTEDLEGLGVERPFKEVQSNSDMVLFTTRSAQDILNRTTRDECQYLLVRCSNPQTLLLYRLTKHSGKRYSLKPDSTQRIAEVLPRHPEKYHELLHRFVRQ